MRLFAWGKSDVGMRRERNEDAFVLDAGAGLFAVADGMGGHQGGQRASRTAIAILERVLSQRDLEGTQPIGPHSEPSAARLLRGTAVMAGRVIYDLARTTPELAGMGTTLTALLFKSGRAYLAHVGDSRAYLLRDERIEQLTDDHSWIEEQVRSGMMTSAEAQESALKHIITRSVGFERNVEVDQITMPFLLGDCFLLCSDGLSNHVTDEEIRRCVSQEYYADVPERLVELANLKGGEDNITVVLVYVANDVGRFSGAPQRSVSYDRPVELPADIVVETYDPYAPTMPPTAEMADDDLPTTDEEPTAPPFAGARADAAREDRDDRAPVLEPTDELVVAEEPTAGNRR